MWNKLCATVSVGCEGKMPQNVHTHTHNRFGQMMAVWLSFASHMHTKHVSNILFADAVYTINRMLCRHVTTDHQSVTAPLIKPHSVHWWTKNTTTPLHVKCQIFVTQTRKRQFHAPVSLHTAKDNSQLTMARFYGQWRLSIRDNFVVEQLHRIGSFTSMGVHGQRIAQAPLIKLFILRIAFAYRHYRTLSTSVHMSHIQNQAAIWFIRPNNYTKTGSIWCELIHFRSVFHTLMQNALEITLEIDDFYGNN